MCAHHHPAHMCSYWAILQFPVLLPQPLSFDPRSQVARAAVLKTYYADEDDLELPSISFSFHKTDYMLQTEWN